MFYLMIVEWQPSWIFEISYLKFLDDPMVESVEGFPIDQVAERWVEDNLAHVQEWLP